MGNVRVIEDGVREEKMTEKSCFVSRKTVIFSSEKKIQGNVERQKSLRYTDSQGLEGPISGREGGVVTFPVDTRALHLMNDTRAWLSSQDES